MNTFGKIFKISIFGESHGPFVGITLDGVPAGIQIDENDFMEELKRRSPYYEGSTERIEDDHPIIISGIKNNYTNGFPLTILFENKNTNKYLTSSFTNINSNDIDGKNKDNKTKLKNKLLNKSYYNKFLEIPRPSHVDFAGIKKWGKYFEIEGSGHLSGRLTVCLVAAGVIANKIIKKKFNKKIKIKCEPIEILGIKNKEKFEEIIKKLKEEGDSAGGILQCKINGVEAGIGEPFFYSLESAISSIIFSIPSIKGIEFGAGFNFSKMRGSQANDLIINKNGKTKTNNNGGITGGISNGNEIIFNIVAKPVPSIKKEQNTFNIKKNKLDNLIIKGNHDSCHILRLPPIIESAVAIALLDLYMTNKAINL